MKTLVISLLLFLIVSNPFAHADHLMGGEITWKCMSASSPDAGKFVFQMVIYRDCNGAAMSCCGPFNLNSNSPAGTITMHEYDTVDVSPSCNPDSTLPHIVCGSWSGSYDTGAVEQYVYKSDPVTINGVPPLGGWTFYWESCCRNLSIENILCPSYRLRAKMYPYNGQNTYPCFNSSPEFYEQPKAVICTGYEFTFSQSAADQDFDSLRYDWAYPQETGGFNCSFASGYAYDNPLPDASENPLNVGAVLDPSSGEITFTSFTGGSYVLCHKVSEYRCGTLIAEVFRDIQVILMTCRLIPGGSANLPPLDSTVDSSGNPFYVDTVLAGDTVQFSISISDSDLDPVLGLQYIHLQPSGMSFSEDFTDSLNCLHTPCALLSPNPLDTIGQSSLTYQFRWVTSCNHLSQAFSCQANGTVHNFVFKAFDDFCPIPGLNLFTVSVTVLPPPGMLPQLLVYNSGDTLFSSVSAGNFQWYRNDTIIAGAVGNYYVPPDTGWYSAELLLAGGCSNRSAAFYFAPVATKDMAFDLDIFLSPNPFYQTVKLSAQSRKAIHADATLWNAFGQRISSWSYNQNSNRLEEEMDLSLLPSGVYFLEFYSGGARKTFQLVRMEAAY